MNKYGVGTNKHVSGEKRKNLQTGFLCYQEKPCRFSVTFSTLICMQPGVLIGHIVMCRPRVWFLNVLDLKKGINFDHFGLKIGCVHSDLAFGILTRNVFFSINFGTFLALLKCFTYIELYYVLCINFIGLKWNPKFLHKRWGVENHTVWSEID